MADKLELQAQDRQVTGSKVKTLRTEGVLPAVMYGHGFEPKPIQVNTKEFEAVYTEAGASTLVYIKLGNDTHPIIIKDVVVDPVQDTFLHADFHKVKLDEKVKAHIPLTFIGESPAVKNLSGVLVKNIQEIEVEGLPQDLPHEIEVDVTGITELEGNLLIKDLNIGTKVTITANPEDIVVLVQAPMSDEQLAQSLETKESDVESVEVAKKPEKEEASEGDKKES